MCDRSPVSGQTLGRALALGAGVCYALALLLPFVRGSIRLFEIVPVGRGLTLPQFAQFLAREGQLVPLGALGLTCFAAPLVLLLALLPAALAPPGALPAPLARHLAFWRLRGWAVPAAGAAMTAGVRASSGNADNPALHLQPGAWALIAALALAAAATTLLATRRARPAPAPAIAPPDPSQAGNS